MVEEAERFIQTTVSERACSMTSAHEALGNSMANLPTPMIPVSWGELLDKITILEIKADRITDPGKRANVESELRALMHARDAAFAPDPELARLVTELRGVNEALWDIEDEIRLAEHAQDFGARFVGLARAVYQKNDRRSVLKRTINEHLASELVEEKSYLITRLTHPR